MAKTDDGTVRGADRGKGAIAMTRLGDPVASNPLGPALFPDLFPVGQQVLNGARYLFLDERSRLFYPDWETTAREAVSGMRLLAGQDPIVGDMTIGYEVLTLASTPGLSLMTYLAEPATPSADAMNLLRSWTANAARTSDTAAPAAETPVGAPEPRLFE